MFGYPSGLGALLVRKEASQLLNKLYFGGGAVDYCTAEDIWHVFSPLPAGKGQAWLSMSAFCHNLLNTMPFYSNFALLLDVC